MGACTSNNLQGEAGAALPVTAKTSELVRASKQRLDKSEVLSHSQFILQNAGKLSEVYEIDQKKLGEGSYGCVALGRHRATGVPRAIKKISKAQVKDLKALRQEIAMMKMLDHPNIIRLFETFEDRSHIFLVMELCEGGELFDRIVEAGHFSESDAAHVVRDMLRAVFYMHEQEVVHRDLKPENFLLQSTGPLAGNLLKLIDFGTAREAMKSTVLTTKIGTPFYISPQVVKGKYDRTCDLWSVGAIMYTLLCGRPPFNGTSDAEIMTKVRSGRLTFKEAQWQYTSDEAKFLCRQLMRMSPRERMSADMALGSEWIRDMAPKGPDLHIDNLFVERWRSYKGQNRLRKAALHIIAGQLNDGQTKKLRETFIALDADGNGLLTLSELKEGLEKAGLHRTESEIHDFVNALDADGSGVIDYTEFVAASLDGSGAIDEDVCFTAFNLFDRDGDGEISMREITDVLYHGRTRASSEDLMCEVDTNNDGKIDFQEFMDMMGITSTCSSTKTPTPTPACHSAVLAAASLGGA